VVSPNSDFFRYFNDPQGRRPQGARNSAAQPTAAGTGDATTGAVR
jgi:membrane protease subunit HflC